MKCATGSYASAGHCVACTLFPQFGYWLTPVLFNSASDACPWDCIAGYQKSSSGAFCMACTTGVTYSASVRTTDNQAANQCIACSSCTAGKTYRTAACTTTHDTVCVACRASCNAGYYMVPCTLTSNAQCLPCKATCGAGNYMVGTCSGGTTSDTITCKACTSPTTCMAGTFLSPTWCPGTTSSNVYCQTCQDQKLACESGTFKVPCTSTVDTRCQAFTTCNAGYYLTGYSLTSDGSCAKCTDCAALGLTTAVACSSNRNTLCSGTGCNTSAPCISDGNSNYFCSFDTGGMCGRCPRGYSSDGMDCSECQRDRTCNYMGSEFCQVYPCLCACLVVLKLANRTLAGRGGAGLGAGVLRAQRRARRRNLPLQHVGRADRDAEHVHPPQRGLHAVLRVRAG